MCGQLTAYNTYATLSYTKPLFLGFFCYQNVNKEIICATFGSSGNGLFAGFQELRMLLRSAWFWKISNKQVT